MLDLDGARRECVRKRSDYLHARDLYIHASLIPDVDASALRDELSAALLAYYAAHSALHTAMRRVPAPADQLH